MDNSEMTNLEAGERALRMVVTLATVLAVLNVNGELGYMTLLPLFAIYTGITAVIGWDPIDALISNLKSTPAPDNRISGVVAH